jgi:wyosine [tRNA(Phe)-imidazoG37] synthetase (radical SAM superfamily)
MVNDATFRGPRGLTKPRGLFLIMDYHYLFGPVPSRRFGRSLGVDLVPAKTCSFDCPFCEVGPTTVDTLERAEYVPTDAVIDEIRRWLAAGGAADVITMHVGLGEIIDAIHASCDIPVVLLSNSSLMHLGAVREAAAKADIVKGSLSAWDELSFHRVNRPAAGLALDAIVAGLREFRKGFTGQLWIEVFLLRGVNDAPEDVAKIAALVESIAPDVVQLNTVVRPPAYGSAEALTRDELAHLAPLFTPPAEIIARFESAPSAPSRPDVSVDQIRAMLVRRPCTLDDIAGACDIKVETATRLVEALVADGAIHPVERDDGTYYAAS